jgi:hypothetical protein
MKKTKMVFLELTEKEFDALDIARDYLLEQYTWMDSITAHDYTEIVNVLDEMTWHDN